MIEEVDKIGLDLKFAPEEIPEAEKIAPDPAFDYEPDPKIKILSNLTGGIFTGNLIGDATRWLGKNVRQIPNQTVSDLVNRNVPSGDRQYQVTFDR